MKKSTKVKTSKQKAARPIAKAAPVKTATSDKGLVSADIRKAYKSRLISAYFNRQH